MVSLFLAVLKNKVGIDLETIFKITGIETSFGTCETPRIIFPQGVVFKTHVEE